MHLNRKNRSLSESRYPLVCVFVSLVCVFAVFFWKSYQQLSFSSPPTLSKLDSSLFPDSPGFIGKSEIKLVVPSFEIKTRDGTLNSINTKKVNPKGLNKQKAKTAKAAKRILMVQNKIQQKRTDLQLKLEKLLLDGDAEENMAINLYEPLAYLEDRAFEEEPYPLNHEINGYHNANQIASSIQWYELVALNMGFEEISVSVLNLDKKPYRGIFEGLVVKANEIGELKPLPSRSAVLKDIGSTGNAEEKQVLSSAVGGGSKNDSDHISNLLSEPEADQPVQVSSGSINEEKEFVGEEKPNSEVRVSRPPNEQKTLSLEETPIPPLLTVAGVGVPFIGPGKIKSISKAMNTQGTNTVTIPEKQNIQKDAVSSKNESALNIQISRKNLEPKGIRSQVKPVIHDSREGGRVFGVLNFDDAMVSWLEESNGHVELYIHPVNSKEPQDTVFLDYQYPEVNFDFDFDKKQSAYRLFAGIYIPDHVSPIAQIPYESVISSRNYRQKARFHISKSIFDQRRRKEAAKTEYVSLLATVFEGGSGDFRNHHPVKEASIEVVGYPEAGVFKADGDGNVRIKGVPRNSQILIKIRAPGFYDSYRVSPIFQTDGYASVYLISRDKIDTITKYFTKSPQRERNGVIMGRVFDVESRGPSKNERLRLSQQRTAPLYFDSFPDVNLKETTEVGLFAFLNVIPSMRVLRKDGGTENPMLLDVKENSGLFVEVGRGGAGSMKGRIVDPFTRVTPDAKIKMVGSKQPEKRLDENGYFSINNLESPAGTLLIEVEARGYPLSWYTIPWDAQHNHSVSTLYMLETDLLEESMKFVKGLKPDPEKGMIIGGAEKEFFEKGNSCIVPQLLEDNGKEVGKDQGPYYHSKILSDRDPFCINQHDPSFVYYNLPSGQYILRWNNAQGKLLKNSIVYVGIGRVSVMTN